MIFFKADEPLIQENILSYMADITPPITVNNGISINWTQVGPNWHPSEYYPLIGGTEYRHPHNPPTIIAPDMQHGTNGTLSFLMDYDQWSNEQLLLNMNSLLVLSTSGNSTMGSVADLFLYRFKNKTGGDYYNTDLSNVLRSSGPMYNALKNIGQNISSTLKNNTQFQNNPNSFMFNEFLLANCRPVFSGDWISGSTILLNDVEINQVYLESLNVNKDAHTWSATLYLNILDHFGLDDDDISGQNLWRRGVIGFGAWWTLQHKRDYTPFRSVVRLRTNINGSY